MKHTLCAPCLLGLEGIAADEFRRLGMEDVRAENGRVFFTGGDEQIARANIWSRYTERILISVASFHATSFEALFEGTHALAWEQYIPKNAAFPVRGHTLHSKLMSVPDCQRIIKKAVVERLRAAYGTQTLPETDEKVQIQFLLMKDAVALYIDTTGAPLYKRGWRTEAGDAPLRETLAAALVDIARYRGRDVFFDPFCGSGTIAIEAVLKAQNRAPGLARPFDAERFSWMERGVFNSVRTQAREAVRPEPVEVRASDIDPQAITLATANARRAGVGEHIRFERADAANPAVFRDFEGLIVTNPPYGERLSDKQGAQELYRAFGRALQPLAGKRLYLLSAHEQFEKHFGRDADKKRKLYNGMMKCELFMYYHTEHLARRPDGRGGRKG